MGFHRTIPRAGVLAAGTAGVHGVPRRVLWKGLNMIGMVDSQREVDGKTATEYRFYIGRIGIDAARFAPAVRGHWRIENDLHWSLDVAFRSAAIRWHRLLSGTLVGLFLFALSNKIGPDPSSSSCRWPSLCRGPPAYSAVRGGCSGPCSIWRKLQKRLTATPPTQWITPLQGPFWDRAAARYRKIRWLPRQGVL